MSPRHCGDALVFQFTAENMSERLVRAFDYSGNFIEDESAHDALATNV
jgi:hypothetical protein